jgi:hypothetical protein
MIVPTLGHDRSARDVHHHRDRQRRRPDGARNRNADAGALYEGGNLLAAAPVARTEGPIEPRQMLRPIAQLAYAAAHTGP